MYFPIAILLVLSLLPAPSSLASLCTRAQYLAGSEGLTIAACLQPVPRTVTPSTLLTMNIDAINIGTSNLTIESGGLADNPFRVEIYNNTGHVVRTLAIVFHRPPVTLDFPSGAKLNGLWSWVHGSNPEANTLDLPTSGIYGAQVSIEGSVRLGNSTLFRYGEVRTSIVSYELVDEFLFSPWYFQVILVLLLAVNVFLVVVVLLRLNKLTRMTLRVHTE